jgi:hypothetical protein
MFVIKKIIMRIFKYIAIIVMAASVGACASRYKKINPEQQIYNSIHTDGGVSFEYKFDVLKKKYKKKETKKKLKVISVKLTNTSGRDLTVGRDLRVVHQNGNEITLIDNEALYKEIKQSPASYLFYMLLTPVNLYTGSSPTGATSTIPVGLAIGPGITLGNMLTASGANKKLRKELASKSLYGRTVANGETVFGVLAIRSESYDPLQIKVY